MGDRIKTAMEKAMERAATFREVPPEEIEKLESVPIGRTIAASFINNSGYDLEKALAETPPSSRKYILEGLEEVLLLNISLSDDNSSPDSLRRAMEGISIIKKDKKRITSVLGELDVLLNYYRQTMEQAREKFRQEYEMQSRMQGARRGSNKMQEFREEWAAMIRQLNEKYEANLAQIKETIRSIN
ncbi:MAG: hypothetical protein ACOY31_08610 [Bacillota bacterium]